MTPAARSLVLTMSILLGGCTLFPKAGDPPPRIDSKSVGLSSEAAPAIPDGWWRAFNDEQLNRIIATALKGNPSLLDASARMGRAQAAAETVGAVLLPSLSLDGHETRVRYSRADAIPPPFNGATLWQGALELNFEWDLDFFGRQRELIHQAVTEAQASTLDIAAARLALAGAISQAYVNYYRFSALQGIARDALQQRAHILDITRKRVSAGLDTQLEVREAEGAVPRARVQREQAEAGAELSVHQLVALMGEGAGDYATLHAPALDPAAVLPLPSALPADLLARRPDLIAARIRVESALSGQRAAEAAFYPDVSLTAFAGQSAIGLNTLFQAGSGTWGMGPSIHLPLYRHQLTGQLHEAAADVSQRVVSYNAAVVAAVQQAADELTRLRSLAQQISDQGQSQQAAEQAYHLAMERYEHGLSNYLDVLNAETEVLEARRQRLELQCSELVSRVSLLLAVGGSFDASSATQVSILPSRATP